MTTPRILPSIDQLRQRPGICSLETEYGASAVLSALRTVADALRHELGGPAPPVESREQAACVIEQRATQRLGHAFAASLMPVINATGVIVHTNLGRAPLAAAAARRVAEVGAGYANLEYDLTGGQRGSRSVHAEQLLTRVTGAPAAAVVNNNAAAVLLVLAALASGREAIVSRGELVEIGGGFRIPDVMRQSGADVREVGTTNKTRTADYAAAISDRTAVILRVHPSNFRIEGFTERPRLDELVALGQRFEIPVVEDLGSGNLLTAPAETDIGEPVVAASVAAGVSVCCFSGDKLLGGPQAGIIVGDQHLVSHIRSHPLMRALRVDKMTYAALEATLLEYARGRAETTIPVARMLYATTEAIGRRAHALADRLAGHALFTADVVEGLSTVGGGGAPGSAIATRLTRLTPSARSASWLESRLRELRPPVIARIVDDRVLLDLRTVLPEQDERLIESLRTLA
jgi:L-seryl-tRNA(Ser) seleniumtransferase